MKKIVSLVVILAALVGALYFIFSFTDVRSPFSAPTATQGIQLQTARVHEVGDSYTVSAQYPQFGMPTIDAQIKKAVDDTVDEIKSYPANPADSATPKNSLDGTFDKVYVGPDVVSVELILSQYTGGAHGNTMFLGMNFDRATGRRLELADALGMTGLTLDQLSAKASTQLRTELGAEFQFSEGANNNPENFSSFIISADKVTFIFQQYQVASYAAGPQQVSFARKDLTL